MNKIIQGDCRDVMRDLITKKVKVQTCVTSPPYFGLRDYGVDGQIGLESCMEEFLESMVEVFSLVHDLLDDSGTLWLNLGDSYSAGGNGGQGSGSGSFHGHKSRGNVDLAGKPKKTPGFKPKQLLGIPWRVAFALQDSGWYLRQDIIWSKPNPMPESVKDRCTKSHEYIFLLSKSKRYFFDHDSIKEKASYPKGPNSPESIASPYGQGFSREYKSPDGWDTSVGEGGHGTIHKKGREKGNRKTFRGGGAYTQGGSFDNQSDAENNSQGNEPNISGLRGKRSVWTVATRPYSQAHFATYPEELIEPCILAGSKPGDIVFDPFMGSGTTAAVAQRLGRNYLGSELNPEYFDLHDDRIGTQPGMPL